jgi:hypothetical protein
METTLPLNDIDFLLRRNWFFDRESIIDLLYLADEYSWEWIVENRRRYDRNIFDIICNEAHIELPTSKMKVVDLSDEEYERMLIDKEREKRERIDKQWATYKKIYDVSRPECEFDIKCEEVYQNIQAELELVQHKKMIPTENQNRILALQNEFEKLKTRIQQEDRDWEYLTRTELILNGTLSKMQKEIDSGSHM